MKHAIIYILLFTCATSFSQTCIVEVDALKGQYVGDCKKGKADGNGTATGIDSFTGSFKNGRPNGQGKYSWKNGSWYDGAWKDGLFEGKGTFSQVTGKDSVTVITGFWRKGKFVGNFEKPYIIHNTSSNVNEANIRKLNDAQSQIEINVKSITSGASDLSSPVLPKAKLVNIQVYEGRFEQQVSDESSSKFDNKYILRKVTFPFHAVFTFESTGKNLSTEKVDVEFNENCGWYFQVNIDN